MSVGNPGVTGALVVCKAGPTSWLPIGPVYPGLAISIASAKWIACLLSLSSRNLQPQSITLRS